jgi:hypothetical protein
VPVLQLCIIRSFISFCTSIAAGSATGIKPLFGQRQHFPMLTLRGLFGTVAISTSYLALLSLPLGDAVTISQVCVCVGRGGVQRGFAAVAGPDSAAPQCVTCLACCSWHT